MAQFFKNLVFIIMLVVFFVGLPLVLYYIVFVSSFLYGSLVFGASVLLAVAAIIIAGFYHKRNIHITNHGVLAGWVTVFFLWAVILFCKLL